MNDPRIDKHLQNDKQLPLRPFLVAGIPFLVMLLAFLLTFFQGCTELGSASKHNIYDPTSSLSEDEGFVGKSNQLLRHLLAKVDSSVEATCLDSLNKRYKALEFALPYGEEHKAYIEAADLRLVAVHPEYISDDDLRVFYYNSRLPQLLRLQSQQKGETFFRLTLSPVPKTVRGGVKPIVVKDITLIPSMFKVMLTKSPWTGTIYANDNCLFSDTNAVFLSYGNTVLPLRTQKKLTRDNPILFQAVMHDGTLLASAQPSQTTKEPTSQTPRRPAPIDYYDYYTKAFATDAQRAVRIELHDEPLKPRLASFLISCTRDSILISANTPVNVVADGQSLTFLPPTTGSQRPPVIPFRDGMKLIVYDMQNQKMGEFALQRENPARVLSCLVHASTGTSRFYIAPEQTDLFTQQMLKGLARHFSSSDNIDSLQLSIDPLLSREFEADVKRYLHDLQQTISREKPASQVKEQYDMSVTIMDLATGDILASPFYNTLFDSSDFPVALRMTTRNAALSRRSIGSVFKPMVALAAVEATPSLLNMDTQAPRRYSVNGSLDDPKAKATFFGRSTYAWARKSATHWGGCNFTTFLQRSDDVYPVALAALAMTGQDMDAATITTLPLSGNSNFFELGRGQMLKFKRFSDANPSSSTQAPSNGAIDTRDHPFTDWLAYLYNTSYDKDLYVDLNPFAALINRTDPSRKEDFGLEEVSPELTSLRMDRFYDGDDFKARLVPWVLGQGDNAWNCIKLTEAWARMIGKYDVKASFLRSDTLHPVSLVRDGAQFPSSSVGQRSLSAINATWNSFLDKLSSAQKGGSLLKQMNDRVDALNKAEHTSLTLFSKTGTPDAYIRYEFPMLGGNNRYVDVGLYAFALTDGGQYERIRQNQPAKGIVCVVRITRSYQCRQCRPGHQCRSCESFWGLKSAHARDFFAAASSHRLEKLYHMTKSYY